mmetsp:Transcript_15490/g.43924  ORF Transcript_15490/g.43924 Transcript_15490/m.43924 type:complete len:104 (+) Transcript_15490:261-572(+)
MPYVLLSLEAWEKMFWSFTEETMRFSFFFLRLKLVVAPSTDVYAGTKESHTKPLPVTRYEQFALGGGNSQTHYIGQADADPNGEGNGLPVRFKNGNSLETTGR